ncbi:alpha/beta hydrolase family protein [Effusibacillus lacus]|uniref:Esterase n=1 Tax=Effusibacillus lacus TaxID=1348429 RepID=A0A292YNF7_9BACL|nr:alpha/beta hydrolase [Effusibacillus lacus]TCS71394.1 hypothetical protein EDD64_12612 [Effusibacillus lacus]GAX89924.1 esterase [Effusibacillus lacus]
MIHVDKIMIRDIPVYRVQDGKASRNPVVIALHGLGKNKESLLPYAESFAGQGAAVLIPDAPRHGERASGGKGVSLNSVHKLFPILVKCLKDVGTLLEFVKSDERYDATRIGITGVSMGGAVTLGALANHPEIKTGVALLTMDSARKFARHHRWPKVMWPAASYLDSLLDRKRIPPRSLLMLNGSEDPLIPVAEVREFVAELKTMYRNNGRVEMIEYPGVGHEVVPDMVSKTSEWFANHL